MDYPLLGTTELPLNYLLSTPLILNWAMSVLIMKCIPINEADIVVLSKNLFKIDTEEVPNGEI